MLLMGKLTISMAIFNSCVCLPEGKIRDQLLMMFFSIVLAVATWKIHHACRSFPLCMFAFGVLPRELI